MLRLWGTPLYAEYYGAAQGAGEVILADCDSSRLAQNWEYLSDGDGGDIVNTLDQSENGYPGACLSADKFPSGATEVDPIIVNPTNGCTGSGGQNWGGF